MKNEVIVSISRHYRKAVVWQRGHHTALRIAVHSCTPDRGQTEAQRKVTIELWLWKNFQVEV